MRHDLDATDCPSAAQRRRRGQGRRTCPRRARGVKHAAHFCTTSLHRSPTRRGSRSGWKTSCPARPARTVACRWRRCRACRRASALRYPRRAVVSPHTIFITRIVSQTHAPAHLLPWRAHRGKTIVVTRDAADTAVSMCALAHRYSEYIMPFQITQAPARPTAGITTRSTFPRCRSSPRSWGWRPRSGCLPHSAPITQFSAPWDTFAELFLAGRVEFGSFWAWHAGWEQLRVQARGLLSPAARR